MQRLTRHTLNTVTFLSLLLFVATASLWVRSYWRFVDFGHNSSRRDATAYVQHVVRLGSMSGRLLFTRRDLILPWADPPTAQVVAEWERGNGWYWTQSPQFDLYRVFPPQPGERTWQKDFAGCRFTRVIELNGNNSPSTLGVVVIVPYAYVCAVLTVLPVVYAWRLQRYRMAVRKGLCLVCRYDLTGNVSGVCPECGTAIPKSASEIPK